MENARKKSQAFIGAVGFEGFISAEINGETLVVIGEGMDAIELTRRLRKKMGFAELSGITTVEEKKEEKEEKKEDKITPQEFWTYQTQYERTPQPFFVDHQYCNPVYTNHSCCIM